MRELLAHLTGDYLTQTHWEATRKTEELLPAVTHAVKYAACFLPLTRDPKRLAVIGGTHFVIDHWRLARRLTWAKNQLAPKAGRYSYSVAFNGSSRETPAFMHTWLMIINDNTLHMLINHLALRGTK